MDMLAAPHEQAAVSAVKEASSSSLKPEVRLDNASVSGSDVYFRVRVRVPKIARTETRNVATQT